ncbi:DUF2188 domain-containing protein [Halodesulfovibrio marinisediminis]|uniref:DUF2188 domain-containing protein n=1 Tax=Halodesulfovibrio marinisediminis DSM 17456 TaxID=1121457 RepID=A0A1N6IWD5_9BACT|nr:DUF2188 domain-containing protein [Halodesulfovibrio marinisediminis]SIO36329.1 hypothetical protein SAMN02745161_3002 [Halodesulfovibrio marinisediminis DSM 17456]
MKRVTFFVRPSGGKWKVKREGAEKEYRVCETKQEGVRVARILAGEFSPAQIIIEKEDGTFQQEWTHTNCSVLFEGRGRSSLKRR